MNFFSGTVDQALDAFGATGGLLAIPASPALSKLRHDESYRKALQQADFVLLDSNLIAAAGRFISGRPLRKVSGVAYLKTLLRRGFHEPVAALWVVGSSRQQGQTAEWLAENGVEPDRHDFWVSVPGQVAEAHDLLMHIEERRPRHIMIATAAGTQERLGLYLRDYLLYRPCIHCVGSALALLTGAERAIPAWAEAARLGWLVRFATQPRMILPRLGIALSLLAMLARYRSELPPLRPRWADV